MTRSLPATDASCQAAPRQQMNSLSAYIDAKYAIFYYCAMYAIYSAKFCRKASSLYNDLTLVTNNFRFLSNKLFHSPATCTAFLMLKPTTSGPSWGESFVSPRRRATTSFPSTPTPPLAALCRRWRRRLCASEPVSHTLRKLYFQFLSQ